MKLVCAECCHCQWQSANVPCENWKQNRLKVNESQICHQTCVWHTVNCERKREVFFPLLSFVFLFDVIALREIFHTLPNNNTNRNSTFSRRPYETKTSRRSRCAYGNLFGYTAGDSWQQTIPMETKNKHKQPFHSHSHACTAAKRQTTYERLGVYFALFPTLSIFALPFFPLLIILKRS